MNGTTEDVLLTETVRARSELLEKMNINSGRLFTLLNICILLLGIVSTSAFFISSINVNVLIPVGICISLLICGLFMGFIGILPEFFEVVMKPKKLYEMKVEDRVEVINRFLVTYMIEQNRLIVRFEDRPFIIKNIIMLVITAIGEYAFSWLCLILEIHMMPAMMISLGLTGVLLYFLLDSYSKYTNRKTDILRTLGA